MRVGLVLREHAATYGGGHSFQELVLDALKVMDTAHEWILLALGPASLSSASVRGLTVVDLSARCSQSRGDGDTEGVVRRALRAGVTVFGLRPVVRRLRSAWGALKGQEPSRPIRSRSMLDQAAVDLELDLVWFPDPFAELVSVPFFVTVWDLEHRKHPFLPEFNSDGWPWDERELHYRKVLPRAARIFCGTETGRREIVDFYGVFSRNIVVNPFVVPGFVADSGSVDPGEVLRKHGLSPGFLFYPAQLWPHKNHANLLIALKMLADDHGLTPALVLTGSGDDSALRIQIGELGLADRVYLLGFVDVKEMPALYRSAGALVYCSLFGPDNLPPLEAFAMGCPVIAAHVHGASDQLGDAAVFFNPVDPSDIAAKIARVLTDAPLRRNLVSLGQRIVQGRTPASYGAILVDTVNQFAAVKRNWH